MHMSSSDSDSNSDDHRAPNVFIWGELYQKSDLLVELQDATRNTQISQELWMSMHAKVWRELGGRVVFLRNLIREKITGA